MQQTIAVCGAGIAGIATAYYLSAFLPTSKVVLIDKLQPMSFTSSKSGENFRDYWPHPCMEALSSRSIELMKGLRAQYGRDTFAMRFSGYHFVSHQKDRPNFADDTAADFRVRNKVTLDSDSIHKNHPYLDEGICKSVFIKNAGNVDAYALGSLLLRVAKQRNLQFYQTEIKTIIQSPSGIKINCFGDEGHQTIECDQVVLATGPFLGNSLKELGLQLPIWNTCQAKFVIPDTANIIPPKMPFTIYADGQTLDWPADQHAFLQENEATRWMTEALPGAIHIRPEVGGKIKMGWAFSHSKVAPNWEPTAPDYFPEIVLKGASRFIPKLATYANRIPTPLVSYAGYYTRTKENWPLIGATKLENVFVVGALAGFGTMTACAAGELCAQQLTGKPLPWYAPYFQPSRYDNPRIQAKMERLQLDGQL